MVHKDNDAKSDADSAELRSLHFTNNLDFLLTFFVQFHCLLIYGMHVHIHVHNVMAAVQMHQNELGHFIYTSLFHQLMVAYTKEKNLTK